MERNRRRQKPCLGWRHRGTKVMFTALEMLSPIQDSWDLIGIRGLNSQIDMLSIPNSLAFVLGPLYSHPEATESWPHWSLISMLGVKAPSSVMALISNFTDYLQKE